MLNNSHKKSGEWESRFEIKLKLSIYCEEETDWNHFDIGKTNWIFSIKEILIELNWLSEWLYLIDWFCGEKFNNGYLCQ